MVELYLLSFPLTPITLIKDWLNGQQSSSNSFGYRIISPFSFFVSVLVFLTAFFKNWSPFSHSLLQFGTAASWTWFPVGHTFPVWVVFISWFSPLFYWISSSHKFIKRVHEWQDFQTFCVWKYLLNLHTWLTSMCVSHSVVSDSLQPHGLQLTGPSVHGTLQARTPEWVAIPFSRGSSQPREWNWVSCTVWATGEALWLTSGTDIKIPGNSLSCRMWRWCSTIWHTRLLEKSNANLILESLSQPLLSQEPFTECSLSPRRWDLPQWRGL